MSTGLREVTDSEFDEAIERVLVPRLTALLAARGPGHCVRVIDIHAPLAERLCRRLREAIGGGAQIHVLGQAPAVAADIAVSGTKLVELRNPDLQGRQRPPLLVFIPPGVHVSAEDSFGVATFEDAAVSDVYPDLVSRLLIGVPDELRSGVDDIFALLDATAAEHRAQPADLPERARYLLTLSANGYDREAAGAALFELGLIPDFALFADPVQVRTRVERNASQVRILSRPDRSVRQRVIALHLTDAEFRVRLADFLVRTGLEEPRAWMRRIVVDPANWSLAFQRWPLPEESPAPAITIEVGDLNLPSAGDRPDHADHPVLRTITGQPYLLAGTSGLTQLPVAFDVRPDPRHAAGLTRFAVRLMSEDAGPTGVQATVKVSTTGKSSYQVTLRKLRSAHLEQGWHYLHVLPLDAAKNPLPIASPGNGTSGSSPAGHPLDESDRFYVVTDDDMDEPPARPLVAKGIGVTQILRDLQFTTLADGRDWRSVTCRTVMWKDRKHATIEAAFGVNGRAEITLGPVLAQLERDILADPHRIAPRRISSSSGRDAEILPNGPDTLIDQGEPVALLLQARAAVAEAITGTDGMVSAGRDLLTLRGQAVAYAEAYESLLTRTLQRAQRPDAGPEPLRDLAALLQIDTVLVDHRDPHGVHHEVTLIAPTHPLRLLWLVTWAELGNRWLIDSASNGREAVIAASRNLLALVPTGFPLAVPSNDGRLSMAAQDLTPYWGLCLPSESEDPQALLMDLSAALKVTNSRSVGGTASAPRLADRVERYVRTHPYVQTLVICAVNAGRAEQLADMLIELERRKQLQSLSYDVRLFTADPHLPGTGDALAELLHGTWSTTAEAEAFCTPTSSGIAPKLSVAVRSIGEFRSATNQHTAHVTFLFDAFSGEQFDVGPACDPIPVPVHGLVQQMRVTFVDTDAAVAWHKQPSHGGARDLAGAEECSDLLAALPASIAAATAAVATGGAATGLVPRITLSLDADDTALLHQAHRCSDWVISVDRTLGIEYFDSPGSPRRPDYVIDYAPDGGSGLGHHIVVSSRSVDELRALLTPMIEQHGIQIERRHAGTFFDQLRLLSGRLAFKIASTAANQRTEVLGLAMARLYLDYQGVLRDQILVPLDAHLELYREVRRRADEVAESVTLHRTDLALFGLDARRGAITCRLVEVKCLTALSLTDVEKLKDRITEQLNRSSTVLAENFDPAMSQPDRPDRVVRNAELASLLRHYLGRAVRHGVMNGSAAGEAEWLLDRLDWGYRLDFTRTGLIFDLSGTGTTVDHEAGIEFHHIGRDVIEDLLGAMVTDPVLAAAGSDSLPTSPTLAGRDLTVPLLAEAAFRAPTRAHEVPADVRRQDDDASTDAGGPAVSERAAGEPDTSEAAPTDNDAAAGEPDSGPHGAVLPGTEPPPATSNAPVPETVAVEQSAAVSIAPDVIIGAAKASPQYGMLGEVGGRRIALDLNETHTISLFGVQGGGKSYTLGSIIEAVSMTVPPVNHLPKPLATIVFHYSPMSGYPPEFASMVAPNDDPDQIHTLRERYGAEPAALSDVVMLVPADQVEQRRVEFPAIDVRPLKFGSGELRASHWRFLMGAVGNQSTYIRQLGRIMRANRNQLSLDVIRTGIDQSSLSDQIKQLAQQRLDLAADYIDDSVRIQDLVRPGRMIIVDLRDELIEKDEALGLFVVLMELFAEATSAGERFNKLVVFDEAHKYIESPDLVAGLVESVREMRHKGMSILVASQDPPSVPISLIELSNHVILHRFTSPAWLKHLQKANAALADLTPSKLAALTAGEAYIWSNKATDPAFTRAAVKVRLRPRITRHGGTTRTAVAP